MDNDDWVPRLALLPVEKTGVDNRGIPWAYTAFEIYLYDDGNCVDTWIRIYPEEPQAALDEARRGDLVHLLPFPKAVEK